jgi:hypothetical protein
MDVLFQILLPELSHVEGLERHQAVYSWDGVDYPQEPATYRWGLHVELAPDHLQPHIPRFLPENYIDEHWVFLEVKGDGLDLLEREVNGEEVDWHGRRLDDLLALTLKSHRRWVLIFELQEDQIDHIYELSAEQCVSKFKANLRRDIRREGFIAVAAAS